MKYVTLLLATVSTAPIAASAFAQEQAISPAANTAVVLDQSGQPAAATTTQDQTRESATAATDPTEATAAGDIVVTAQRRTERVQDVPIAISVIGGDQVQRQRINNVADLTRVAASLQLAQNPGGTGGGGYIRGIGQFARSRAAEPSVGIAVDGVVQGLTNVRNLSDIGRIEVLRGPQGTLFGQSVSAGVINITTVEPTTDRIAGKFLLEASDNGFAGSEYGRILGRAAINVPLASNVAVRVAGYSSLTRGVLENTNGRLDRDRELGVRGRLKGEFGNLTVNLIGEYNRQQVGNGGGFATVWRILAPAGTNIAATRSAQSFAACGLVIGIDNDRNCSDGPSIQRFIVKGYSAQLDYDGGPIGLTSITAYRTLDSITNNDIDNLPLALGTSQQQSGIATRYKQFTQEFRATTDPSMPLSLTTGAFLLSSNVVNRQGPTYGVLSRDYTARGNLPIATCYPVATVAACNTFVAPAARNAEAGQDVDNENLSGFGEARYRNGPVTAFGGVRITSAKVEQLGFNGATLSNLRYSDTNITWRLGGQYQFDRDVMAYGTVATGYKSGQVAPIQGTQPASIVYPEKPTSYELGLKTSLFNRRVNVNVNGFYSRVKGYQTSSCAVVNNLVQCIPLNISKVISKGFEGDIFGRISRGWTVNANAAYNIVKYPSGFLADDGTNLGGQQLLSAPKFAATFSTDYAVPLKGALEGFASFDTSYVSRTRLATISNTSDYTFKGHAILGGRIGVRVDNSWSLSVFANNLTGQNDPGSFAAIVRQVPDPTTIQVQSVLQTARSRRLVGIQLQSQF